MDIKITDLLSQLKNETKLEIFSIIFFKGNITVNEVVELSGKNRKNISKQINELVKFKLLTKEIVGRYHMISFNKKLSNEDKKICEIVIQRFIRERRGKYKKENNE